MTKLLAVTLALLVPAFAARAEPQASRAGDVYEITTDREASGETAGGGSSSSTDRDMLTERVVAVRDDGLELEYDLPKSVTPEERGPAWQYPIRVLRPAHGPMRLLNADDMQKRADVWLKAASLPREACGHWYFTWNAFQVECDPQAALPALEALAVEDTELADGALYKDAGATAAAPMRKSGATFIVEMAVDADKVRRQQAETDVVAGEITKKPVTLEAALQARASEQVAGTINVTFDADSTGHAWRRKTVTKIDIKDATGTSETQTVTQTLTRRLVSHGGG